MALNVPNVNAERVLAALARMNINLSAEQIAVLHRLNESHGSLIPNIPPTSQPIHPVVDLSDDETDTDAKDNVATDDNAATIDDATDSEDEDAVEATSKYDLTCIVCGTTFELTRRESQPWYMVFVGRKVGIFQSYKEATKQIDGVTEGARLRYSTLNAAKKAYHDAQRRKKVKVRYSNKEMHKMLDTAELERQKGAAQGRQIAIYYSRD